LGPTASEALWARNPAGGACQRDDGRRGRYALPRLQRRLHPVTASVLLGFLWADWHLPLILTGVYNVTWWQFCAVTIAASIVLSLAFNKSRGSTLSAIVVHGLYNVGTGIILNSFIAKAILYSNPIQHNILWMAYAAVAVLLCFITKGRLGYSALETDI
jgi:membrane protease YdiL (CAAX protease family)